MLNPTQVGLFCQHLPWVRNQLIQACDNLSLKGGVMGLIQDNGLCFQPPKKGKRTTE